MCLTQPITIVPFDEESHLQCPFASLPPEADPAPAQMRYESYQACCSESLSQLSSFTADLYAPLFANIKALMDRAHACPGSVPAAFVDATGCATHSDLGKLLHTHTGAALCVTLVPAHCGNVASACTSFVTQLVEQGRTHDKSGALDAVVRNRELSLELAAEWYEAYARTVGERPVILLTIPGIDRFAAAPLNDFMHSVLLWAHTFGGRDTENAVSDVLGTSESRASLPLLPCIFNTSPSFVLPRETVRTWPAQYFAGPVLQMLDIVHCALPDKCAFWENVVCKVRTNSHSSSFHRRYYLAAASLSSCAVAIGKLKRALRVLHRQSGSHTCSTFPRAHFLRCIPCPSTKK